VCVCVCVCENCERGENGNVCACKHT
jgi:hypothetical protein